MPEDRMEDIPMEFISAYDPSSFGRKFIKADVREYISSRGWRLIVVVPVRNKGIS